MNGILWISSYPRSGNTWFRIFLANLLTPRRGPASIYEIETDTFASRAVFDRAIGWRTSELTAEEADAWRHEVQAFLAQERPLAITKTHDAFVDPLSGRELFSAAAARCAIHLVRNPLDVAVSVSRHWSVPPDEAVRFMSDPHARLDAGGHHAVLPQRLGDWSSHVRSWTDASSFPVLAVRYEDLLATPQATFAQACRFAGLPADEDRVAQAIERSAFDTLQKEEREKWSAQRPPEDMFFRHGRPGAWREVLSPAHVDAMVERHGAMMQRFGYLRADGSVVP